MKNISSTDPSMTADFAIVRGDPDPSTPAAPRPRRAGAFILALGAVAIGLAPGCAAVVGGAAGAAAGYVAGNEAADDD